MLINKVQIKRISKYTQDIDKRFLTAYKCINSKKGLRLVYSNIIDNECSTSTNNPLRSLMSCTINKYSVCLDKDDYTSNDITVVGNNFDKSLLMVTSLFNAFRFMNLIKQNNVVLEASEDVTIRRCNSETIIDHHFFIDSFYRIKISNTTSLS